jgi:hypothetical protein
MKNVIAYSLWGDHPMYWVGAKRNIEGAKKYFPDFICRFYIDKNSRPDLIQSLNSDNVEIVLVESKDSFHGMFWRFWAVEDPEVDIFLSRDCDSRFSDREVSAINEWLASDKDFHIMRDHPYHTTAILGGMWGCRRGLLKDANLSQLIERWNKYHKKGIDQEFLSKVYPMIKDYAFEHSEFGLNYGGDTRPFPTQRVNYEFIGEIYDENDVRNPDHWKLIKNILG